MRSQGISQFYLHAWRLSANGMNHTCLFLPSRRMQGWVGLGGWLHHRLGGSLNLLSL